MLMWFKIQVTISQHSRYQLSFTKYDTHIYKLKYSTSIPFLPQFHRNVIEKLENIFKNLVK